MLSLQFLLISVVYYIILYHAGQAKDILRRIETRDLYHCSWKIRIPKTLSSPSAAGEANVSSRDKGDGDNLWRALMAMSKQPEGESINEFLAQEKKQEIKEKHLWVPVGGYITHSCMIHCH